MAEPRQHAIGDHALLADGRTAALVDPDGNVAWLCWPRIDSAPCLLSILDATLGGQFTVAPADPGAVATARAHVPGTLVLETVWRCGGALLTVRDALACDGHPRLVRTLRASAPVDVLVRARFAPDAARSAARARAGGEVLAVSGAGLDLVLRAPTRWSLDAAGTAEARFTVDADGCAVVLSSAGEAGEPPDLQPTLDWFAQRVPASPPAELSALAVAVVGEQTGRALLRTSAAVLAGLRQRGGGIVAAPTTSLPQWPGSSRTWDYRYSWLRDTALAGLGMLRAGMVGDAAELGDFLGGATTALPPAVLLRVDGTAPPPETVLDHLAGHRGARPVRIGNAAADQPQLDVAGEVLSFAAALAHQQALPDSLRTGAARVADWTAARWRTPDHGIWEIRGTPRAYTHSRVMAWAGLVRALAMHESGDVEGDAAGWRSAAAAIRSEVLAGHGPLQLHGAGSGPDAALAEAVLFGFLDSADPRARATLELIDAELDRGGLVDRHRPAQDTSSDPCAPFIFPTFWMAQALQVCGGDGHAHFAAAVRSRGALDLFGEVADPVGHTPLGNYPQVQSHAAFILAATRAAHGSL